MNYLQQFRQQYSEYNDLSDQEVLDGLYRNHYSDLERSDFDARMAAEVPVPDDDGTIDAATAVGVGADILQQGYYSTAEGIGETFDIDFLKKYGSEGVAQQKEDLAEATGLQQFREIGGVGDTAEFAIEQIGQQLPIMAPMLAGAGVGAKVGSAFGPVGTTVGAVAGGALAGIPLFYGQNRERQKEVSGSVQSEGAAFATAIPQAALDSALGAITLGLGRVGGPALNQLLDAGGGVLTRGAKGFGFGSATEIPTEIGQQALERFQAGLELDSEDAVNEYIDAGAAALFVGGTFGSAGNVVFGNKQTLAEMRAEADDAKLKSDLETVLLSNNINVDDLSDAEILEFAEQERGDDPLFDYILNSGLADATKAKVLRRRLSEIFTGVLSEQQVKNPVEEGAEPLRIEQDSPLQIEYKPEGVREETVVAREGDRPVTLLLNDEETLRAAEGFRSRFPEIDEILNTDFENSVIKLRELRRKMSELIPGTQAKGAGTEEIRAGDFSVELDAERGGIAPGVEGSARLADRTGQPVQRGEVREREEAEQAIVDDILERGDQAKEDAQRRTTETLEAASATVTPTSDLTDQQFETQQTLEAASRVLRGEQASTLGPEAVATVEAERGNVPTFRAVQDARNRVNGLLDRLGGLGSAGTEAARAVRERIEQRNLTGDQALGMLRAAEAFTETLPVDAKNVELRFLDKVMIGAAAAEASGGGATAQEGPGRRLTTGNGLDGIIEISLDQPSSVIRSTAAHEAFHVMQDVYADVDPGAANILNRSFGRPSETRKIKDLPSGIKRMLKKAELAPGVSFWKALSKMESDNEKPIQSGELQAYSYQAYNTLKNQGKKVPGLGGAMSRYMIFNKRFFERLTNKLRGDGFRTASEVFAEVPQTAQQAAVEGVQTQTVSEEQQQTGFNEQASTLALSMQELDQRMPQADRVASPNPRAPLTANSFTSILGGNGGGFNGTQADINRIFEESIAETDGDGATTARDAVAAVGMKPPSAAFWDKAFKMPNRVRYWYEASAESFRDLTNFRTPEALARFIDIVSGTSGGVEPYPNLMRAMGVASEDAQGIPIRTDLRDPSSATKALAESDLNTLKFGNFAGTMQFINGLTSKAPLSTNDTQVASAFGFPGTQLASKPILYEVLSRFYQKLRNVQNDGLTAGEQPYESWQVQALGWVAERGRKKESKENVSDDYGEALPKIISTLQANGIPVPNGQITETTLLDPRVPNLMSGTRRYFDQGRFATVETASELTPEGKRAAEIYEYLRGREETSWIKKFKDQYIRQQRIPMEKLARRKRTGDKKTADPSLLSNIMSELVGTKVDVSRVDPRNFTGWGTFESVMSPNLRIPMQFRVMETQAFASLTPVARRALLAMLGKALGQKAMAASQFTPAVDPANPDTFRVFVQTTDPANFNPAVIEAFERDAGGFPLNIEEVPNGFTIDLNVGGFDVAPDLQTVQDAVDKHLDSQITTISLMDYRSDYIEDSGYVDDTGNWNDVANYDSYINELLEQDDAVQSRDYPRGVGRENRSQAGAFRGNITRYAAQLEEVAADRDDGFRDWSDGVTDRLTKERQQEDARRAKQARITTQDTLNAARDARSQMRTTGEQASALSISTPAFKNWFKDSKVVDGQGNPLVMYHGSRSDIESFDPTLSENNQSHGEFGQVGMYFTEDPDYARHYSMFSLMGESNRGRMAAGETIYPAYLSIQNPLVIKDPAPLPAYPMAGWEGVEKKNQDLLGWSTSLITKARRDALEAQGYDGIINEKSNEIIAFRPTQVKSVYNQGTFDPEDARIQASALGYNPIFAAGAQPTPIKSLLSKIIPTSLKEFRQQMVNGFDPIADLELKVNSGKLRDATRSAFKMAELSLQLTGRTESFLLNGPPVFDPESGGVSANTEIGGLKDIFEPIGVGEKYYRFQDYAYARRADELINDPNTKAEVKQNLEESFPADLRQQALALGNPEFDQVLAKYKAFNDAMLQYLVDTGLISEAQREGMARTSLYVPFYKLADEDAKEMNPDVLGPQLRSGLSNPDAGIKALTGEGGQIGDLYENVIRNAQTFLGSGLRNEAMRRSVDLMGEAGIGGVQREKGPTTVTYKIGGQDRHYNISMPNANGQIDPDAPALFTALTSFSRPQTEGITRVMESIANVFRAGITISPGFMVANFIRGDLAGAVTVDGSLRPLVDSAIGLKAALTNNQSTQDLKQMSGVGGYAFGGRPKGFANAMKRDFRKNEEVVGLTTKTSDVLVNLWNRAERVGEATELATREAIFRRLKEAGVNDVEAAYQGLALINYSRRGNPASLAATALSQIIPLVPFLNARVQGLYRTGSAMSGKEANAKSTILKGMVVTAASMMVYAVSSGDERWKEEPLERKLNYYIFYLGDKKILIPKPFEVGAIFSTIPEFFTDWVMGNIQGKDAVRAAKLTFLNTFAFNPFPQAALPIYEIMANYDFFTGRPIETAGVQRLPSGDRAYATTSQTAVQFGRATGMSPLKFEQLINGYLGSMGSLGLAAVDSVLSLTGAIPSKPAGIFENEVGDAASFLTGLTRFVKESPDSANRFVGDFYELKREVDEIYAAVQDRRKNGEVEAALELMRDNRKKLGMRTTLNRMQSNFTDLNREIRRVKRSDDLDPNQKKSRLNRLVSQRNRVAGQTEKILERID